MIRFLTARAPALSVYAALDPHRYRDDAALERNVAQKRAAGVRGFFTQPLFDLRDIDRCAAVLDDTTTFWGLSPVVSDRSQRYWQQVNRVQFPSEFVPTLHWNQSFALRFLSEIADRGGNAYLMPIKVDIERYLARSSTLRLARQAVASQSSPVTPARRSAMSSSVCHGSPGAAPFTCWSTRADCTSRSSISRLRSALRPLASISTAVVRERRR
jgi:hypothetical protein